MGRSRRRLTGLGVREVREVGQGGEVRAGGGGRRQRGGGGGVRGAPVLLQHTSCVVSKLLPHSIGDDISFFELEKVKFLMSHRENGR